jgi:5'-methylthioadenosine phosphorylase
MVTDYDCWREGHDDVTVDQVVAVLHQNADNASKVVRAAVAAMPTTKTCPCADALKYAILTDRKAIPTETRQKLSILLDKYLSQPA